LERLKVVPKQHQIEAAEFMLRSPYSIIALPPGMGKTLCPLLLSYKLKSPRILVVCPAYLIHNWKSELKKYDPTLIVDVIKKGSDIDTPLDADFVIISYDLAKKAECLFSWANMLVCDECFHGESLVSTPSGEIKIKDLKVGDEVHNCGGIGVIEKISTSKIYRQVRLNYGGRETICSERHPFFTSTGWKFAKELKRGDLIYANHEKLQSLWKVFHERPDAIPDEKLLEMLSTLQLGETRSKEELQAMWERIYGDRKAQKPGTSGSLLSKILPRRVQVSSEQRSNIQEKSDGESGVGKKNVRHSQENGPSAQDPRGEWQSRKSRNGFIKTYFGFRIFKQLYCYWIKKLGDGASKFALSLQTGLRSTPFKARNRIRRGKPPFTKSERDRQEERICPEYIRVDSVEISEQSGLSRHEDYTFYDIQVSGHPSYFVNGALVHNCHYLKEVTTGRTEAIHRYIYENSIKRVYLLTGTPIKNRIEEYYSLISICNYNPKIEFSYFLEKFPEVVSFADHFSYRNEYEIFKGYRKIKIVNWSGLKNEDELKGWLKDIYFTRPASYPPVTRKDVVVCDEADFELEMSFNEFVERGSEASVLPQVKSQAAMNKTKYTIAYCKELLSSGEADSLVIYSDHIEPAKKIAEAFGVEAITGQTRPEVRQKMASDFQFKKTQVIVATIGSFSTGVTLTRANNMVFNDYPWVPGDMEQAEHRINRIGQTRHCVYHRILGSPQDRYILETIESKMNTIKKVT
jgi:intein/homing endonuclease